MAQAALDLEPVTRLRFFVAGRPQTAGSKSAFKNPKTGGVIVTEGGTGKSKEAKRAWRADLRAAATQVAGGVVPFGPADAVALTVVVVRGRPSAQLRSGRHAGTLKDWAVGMRPVARPDTVKLVRAAEDALTGILWADDSQVVEHALSKVFGDQAGGQPHTEGMIIEVSSAGPYMGLTLD